MARINISILHPCPSPEGKGLHTTSGCRWPPPHTHCCTSSPTPFSSLREGERGECGGGVCLLLGEMGLLVVDCCQADPYAAKPEDCSSLMPTHVSGHTTGLCPEGMPPAAALCGVVPHTCWAAFCTHCRFHVTGRPQHIAVQHSHHSSQTKGYARTPGLGFRLRCVQSVSITG